ncbi:hypothetical protein C2E23DRAFT_849217 [Lenzites betulinus]|nr:hypothetical protein C2E23DRAFT_849217 [Lenzites betulinus]
MASMDSGLFVGLSAKLHSIISRLHSHNGPSKDVAVGVHQSITIPHHHHEPPSSSGGTQPLQPAQPSGRKVSARKTAKNGNKTPKESKKKRVVRASSTRKPRKASRSCPSPIKSVNPEVATTWALIRPPVREGATMRSPARTNLSLAFGRPHIWAASREELCEILPEFGQGDEDVIFENTETPVLFLEGPAWEEDRWDGGKMIEFTVVREFVRALPDFSISGGAHAIQRAQRGQAMAPTSEIPSFTPEPLPEVIYQDDMYVFEQEASPFGDRVEIAPLSVPMAQVAPAPVVPSISPVDLTSLAPDDAPSDIDMLLMCGTECIPISIILCHNADLAPFSLPEGCGCAFLGFFSVIDVQTQTEVTSWEVIHTEHPTTLIRGRRTWRFRFQWIPGGEVTDPVALASPNPWWMSPSPGALPLETGGPTEDTAPLQHPYSLLPLHFLAAPAQFVCTDADVKTWRGWHCTSCGRLNLQQNLCLQKCAGCSMSNSLPPISAEYTRQVRGTDPIAFPWDRYPDFVSCISADGVAGLRRFTYCWDASATVHHMFTRNRVEVQAEPTRLFSDLQADVELVSEPVGKGRTASANGLYYIASFAFDRRGVSRNVGIPASVTRARELMIQHVRALSVSPTWPINHLTISAWRTAGNKKLSVFLAERSPVVLLCMGADVELTFWRRRASEAQAMTLHSISIAGADEMSEDALIDIGDDTLDDAEFAPAGESVSTAPKPKAKTGRKNMEEIMMTTLVHGDLLVVYGAVFEYTIKRTGMSIVLLGQT